MGEIFNLIKANEALNTSRTFHHPAAIKNSLERAKFYLDEYGKLDCPYAEAVYKDYMKSLRILRKVRGTKDV